MHFDAQITSDGVVIDLPRKTAERIYEDVADGYMILTEPEARRLKRALKLALKKRR